MKKLKKLLLVIICLLSLTFFYSCTEEDTSTDCNTDYELSVYQQKINAFNANVNYTTCSELKTSALDLINALHYCSDTSYDVALQAWLDLDCSGLSGGTGGGGTGGGTGGGGTGGGTTNGNVMFWTQSDQGCGNISVTLYGQSGTISSYYSSGAPSCGGSGCANFSIPAGTYSYSASCQGYTWSGSVTSTAGGCFKMRLY